MPVVDIGAPMLSMHSARECAAADDHAHYIAHWLEIMKGDKKAIFSAAAAANRAAEYLHGLQSETS